MINFGRISSVFLMGGGRIVYEFAKYLKQNSFKVRVFTSKRYLNEPVLSGQTFENLLLKASLDYHDPDDINSFDSFINNFSDETLAIGFGEVWTFSKENIDRFNNKLLDFMGIRLPQNRGGAHYTWQILRKSRMGACNIQLINEQMRQGVCDSGEIIKTREYLFPASAKKPKDYFDFSVKEELSFLTEFMNEIGDGKVFSLSQVAENFSMYFPRLNTLKHGWIDWSWSSEDIALFINAFDDPYPGASTYLARAKVRLKDVRVEYNDGPFHPFQKGLIYRVNDSGVYVASKDGSIIIQKITGENGEKMEQSVYSGQRFYTPLNILEEALIFRADYDGEGLISG